jgi:chemotaxis response regulator CheB
VAVGASAGGPSALAVLLKGFRPDFPGALAIVQHVDDRFIGGLADWLAAQSPLPLRVAQEGEALSAGSVLLADGRGHLILRPDGRFGYATEPADHPYRPSIDVFFHSVSAQCRGRAAGVLLTGMGSDGAAGLKALRNKGELTIAQDRATSAVYGMPKAAAAAEAACEILPLDRIAARLARAFSIHRKAARP